MENATPAALNTIERDVAQVKGIAEVQPPQRLANGDAVMQAYSTESYISDSSRNAVKQIRDLPDPAGSQLLVAGAAAHFVDLQHSLETHAPIALAIVIVATLIVLFLMTGSVVLPIKQLVMNVLNLSAVFGILVFIFQDGRLEGLLDYRSQGCTRADDADSVVRRRLRPLNRLRRLPALPDQGGPRPWRERLRVRGDRPGTDRAES